MDLIGALSSAAGAAGAAEGAYIEDVFSTYLYTGNGSTQTITNGIDLAGEGGLVWIKQRDSSSSNHSLFDTERGTNYRLITNTTGASTLVSQMLNAFNSDGFTLGADASSGDVNTNTKTYASWTFRKAPKFFDVVTYTGDGTGTRSISHALDAVPGCVIVKRTDAAASWFVYHRSSFASGFDPEDCILNLNNTNAVTDNASYWGGVAPTSTNFSVGSALNTNGATYVAYLFAHDAGGFGDDGLQNVISCGSYTGNGASLGPVVTLGYEPQWVMVKNVQETGYSWYITDSMRGFTLGDDSYLAANRTDAEINNINLIRPLSTGFQPLGTNGNYNNSGVTYIYIAIRRGPMKTPASGTEVFDVDTYTGNATANRDVTGSTNALTDLVVISDRDATSNGWTSNYAHYFFDRLRSNDRSLASAFTASEVGGWRNYHTFSAPTSQGGWGLYGSSSGSDYLNKSGTDYAAYRFSRAPGFFDVVCYTGTGVGNRSVSHNLGVVPELLIVKSRSISGAWRVLSTSLEQRADLNTTDAFVDTFMGLVFGTGGTGGTYVAPTSTTFTVGTDSATNSSGNTYVAYLFATLAGVSKVGSYTGTGTTLQVDCGFSAGARFVLIKRTDSTGDWYVWDSARGIVSGNDPYLLINSTAAEVTSTDYIDPLASGFEISSSAPAAINASGGTFIFLAIA